MTGDMENAYDVSDYDAGLGIVAMASANDAN